MIGGVVYLHGERLGWPMARVALSGERATLIAAVKVIVALAETLGFALLRARTVTEPPAGKLAALYT